MKLETETGSSEFFIGSSLDSLSSHCRSRKIVLIVDSNVLSLYGERLKGFEIIDIGHGERVKNLKTIDKIYERFLELEVDKSHMVVGVGGGVTCDIAGFAASTYMRGIPFSFVPTTLLAQVDASIGGKNGVNLKGYKNLIGTIRQPEFCLIDLNFLKTLPRTEFISGLAEIVKSAAISDAPFFHHLEENYGPILSMEEIEVERAVRSAISIKISIVNLDEMEKWERMKLNFGHTIGHAIEKVARIPHGTAVSLGMVTAAKLSVERGLLPHSEMHRLTVLLQNMGLPSEMEVDRSMVMDAITKDKKKRGDRINMILLQGIGNAVIVPVEKEELWNGIDEVCR